MRKKLRLNRETVLNLNFKALAEAKGGEESDPETLACTWMCTGECGGSNNCTTHAN